MHFPRTCASMPRSQERKMNFLSLYLLTFLPVIVLVGAYCLVRFVFKKYLKHYDTFIKWFLRVTAILAGFFFFIAIYHCDNVMMTTNSSEPGLLNTDVGCVNLVGEPYGEKRFLNFLAWLSITTMFPAIVLLCIETFFSFKIGKFLNKFVSLPIIAINALFVFNLKSALIGASTFDYRIWFIGLMSAFGLSLAILQFLENINSGNKLNKGEIIHTILFAFCVFIFFLPSNTLSTLFTTNFKWLGLQQITLRVYDFGFVHRYVLYFTFIFTMFIYFANRDLDDNARKSILILGSIGALTSFTSFYGADDMFRIVDGAIKVHVVSLPIHLCHTALYVVPICIAFNFKRLFYFTYFINVFGALMAMLWPNVGEDSNIFAPNVTMFWYNHISAFCSPLLCVALGIFEKPKFKQMLWSLLFFGIYFFAVMFLNGWLSNYVEGYDPDVIGSGTDYLFVNGDYILKSVLGGSSIHLMDIRWRFTINGLIFNYYPVYQVLFFFGYVGIAFAMWFIYALFFRIADSHKDLYNRIVILKSQHIHLRERLRMEKINNEVNLHEEAKLQFIDFSKRYGNSSRLSADHVNLTVTGGQIFGFLGPNGAGKSTCIKTAIGIQPVTDGHIEVCGYDVTTQSVQSKRCIGYVPDHYALYEKLTGREYINYIADLYGVSKEDRDMRIAKYVDLFELNQAFDNRMQTYSHGMKQKMTIIAALVHNPKVWILDEPLTGLDPQSIYQVKECMKNHAAEGNIVFFSSHIIDVVEKLCTDIAIIKKGNIVYQNTMANVLKEHPEGLEEFYMNTIRDNGDLDEE